MSPAKQLAELEAALVERDTRIAEQDARIAELTKPIERRSDGPDDIHRRGPRRTAEGDHSGSS